MNNWLSCSSKIGFIRFKRLALLVAFMVISMASFTQILVPELSFKNPVLERGLAGQDGAVYRFSSVAIGVDALVHINGRSSVKVVLNNIDINSTGSENAWQPQINYVDANGLEKGILSDWYMEFKIDFVEAGTVKAVSVNTFNVKAFDNDGNASLQEWLAFYNSPAMGDGIKRVYYSGQMQNETVLGKRFIAAPREYPGIDLQASAAMVHNEYVQTSGFKIRIGARARGPVLIGNGGREYCVLIQSFSFRDPMQEDLPETLTAFKASVHNNSVLLNWATEKDSITSHFLIQRSFDGKSFNDAALIFTEEEPGAVKEYQFKDAAKPDPGKPLYYRLKMINKQQHYAYSEILEVRSEKAQRLAGNSSNPVEDEIDRMVANGR